MTAYLDPAELNAPADPAYVAWISAQPHALQAQAGHRTAPERRFADICPPHRTTDVEYAEWVANVVETLDPRRAFYGAWATEAADWSNYLG